ncbi:conserved hypothetical protein ['Nostoc azollae' 0708]|uniref:Uncharacterized protein n=1 Tax=Nostoc azollae (strain 0708) TaxID=551115 RepID=D7E3E9_NOSA0|nr:conserved hypothetical protein ['Nostoc azollae' 0708]
MEMAFITTNLELIIIPTVKVNKNIAIVVFIYTNLNHHTNNLLDMANVILFQIVQLTNVHILHCLEVLD